jgi:hypothetical protein
VRAHIKQIRATAAIVAVGWDPATLRTEQLNGQDIWPILEEAETVQRPEWKDIANCCPSIQKLLGQWKSLAVRNSILECLWDSTDRQYKIVQTVLPQSRVNVLTELHGRWSGGHLGVNKTLDMVRQRYYWLQVRNNVENWCQQCDTCAASHSH